MTQAVPEPRRPYQLHCGEALEVMADLPPVSVDHVITDPPYSEHVHSSFMTAKNRQADYAGGGANGRATTLGFEHLAPDVMASAAHHFARLARRWVLVFTDVESAPLWRQALTSAGLVYVRTGVWVKPGAAPQFSGDRPGVGYESILVAHKPGRTRWNGGGRHAVWTHPIVSTGERVHTTQKPHSLMSSLIADFTDVGDSVLDPFAGSGSTGVAALGEGRRFIGVEIDVGSHAVALKRLEAAHAQPRLLEATA